MWADIWQAEIPGDPGLIKPHRLISSTYLDFFPMYSPDEQKIAFMSDRAGNTEIYTCNRDGSEPVRITFLKTHSGVPRWSPSGEYLIFDSRPKGNSDIMKVDAQGVKPPINLTDHPADDRVASWSRDGRYIYFGSKRTDEYQIYRMPADGGEPVQITQNGGLFGFESFDSAYFYYKKYDEIIGPIYRINLVTLEESVAIEENVSAFRWSVEKDGIYYLVADKEKEIGR
jgi:Tol biopolymer transport system component